VIHDILHAGQIILICLGWILVFSLFFSAAFVLLLWRFFVTAKRFTPYQRLRR
jgi:hypothetical protein